jgi:hypothetical protein
MARRSIPPTKDGWTLSAASSEPNSSARASPSPCQPN